MSSNPCFYEGCERTTTHSMSWTTLIDGKIEKQIVCWMCEPCFQEWIKIFRDGVDRGASCQI